MILSLSVYAPSEARDSFDRYIDTVEPELLDDIRLMTSEMVTNSVLHSGRPEGDPIEVETSVMPKTIRVQVTDEGEGVAPLEPRSITPPSGLRYVELLSDRWSGDVIDSFQVWFEIDTHSNGHIRRKNPSLHATTNGPSRTA